MHTLLLTLHISVAVVTTLASIGAIVAIIRQSFVQKMIRSMWTSFGATALSGIGLVIMSPQLLVHTCVMMSLYVVVTGAIHYASVRTARKYALVAIREQ